MTDATPGGKVGRRLVVISLLAVVVVAAALGTLVLRKRGAEAREAQARRAEAEAGATVRAVTVALGRPYRAVLVTGEVRAFRQATLYGKVSGYVRKMLVDKGDRVREGQVLAVLESPEAAQELASAEADLVLKQQAARRALALEPSHVVSEQDVDQATSALQVAEAAVARARANLDYATLRAPFTGRVTARYVDEGALVAAATGSTTSVQPILDLADMDRVRVLTYVPQDDALAVREGDPATLQPGRDGEVQARVTRISRSLDPRTRTMLVEIDVANDPPRAYPGQFVPVELHVSRHPLPTVPPGAVIFHGDAAAVGVIEAGRIRFVPVVLGEHDGPNLEVAKGLSGGETVALDAGGLSDGSRVRAVQASAAR